MNLRFWKKTAPEPPSEWTDILDPHGDGTLGPGDAVYDAVMRSGGSGMIMGNFGPEGWVIEEIPEDK